MAIRQLQNNEWKGYFRTVSKGLLGKRAQIEVAALNLGDQIAAEWVPVLGVTYDDKDDILDVALDGLDHLIRRPKEIHVDESEEGVSSFQVVDADGIRHIVQLREPLTLPPPSTAG